MILIFIYFSPLSLPLPLSHQGSTNASSISFFVIVLILILHHPSFTSLLPQSVVAVVLRFSVCRCSLPRHPIDVAILYSCGQATASLPFRVLPVMLPLAAEAVAVVLAVLLQLLLLALQKPRPPLCPTTPITSSSSPPSCSCSTSPSYPPIVSVLRPGSSTFLVLLLPCPPLAPTPLVNVLLQVLLPVFLLVLVCVVMISGMDGIFQWMGLLDVRRARAGGRRQAG